MLAPCRGAGKAAGSRARPGCSAELSRAAPEPGPASVAQPRCVRGARSRGAEAVRALGVVVCFCEELYLLAGKNGAFASYP